MKKRSWLNILYIVLTLGFLAGIAFLDPNVKNIYPILSSVSPLWLLGAVFFMLCFYLGDGFVFHFLSSSMHVGQSAGKVFRITLVGQFYSALTPFSSGGQPFQILYLKKQGVPVGTATSILVLKFLLWQSMVTLIGLIGIAVLWQDVIAGSFGMILWIVLGFCISSLIVVIFILVAFKPLWIHKIGAKIIHFFIRRKQSETRERVIRYWDQALDDYAVAITLAKKNPKMVWHGILATLFEIGSLMGITYFIYHGFGLRGYPFYYIALVQCIHYVVVAFMPLPGATGASEGGFYLFFGPIFTQAFTFTGMLVWRTITYYLTLVLGVVVVMAGNFLDLRKLRRLQREEGANREIQSRRAQED